MHHPVLKKRSLFLCVYFICSSLNQRCVLFVLMFWFLSCMYICIIYCSLLLPPPCSPCSPT
uniref:Uncharacterized protein n=1 Tax=Arundo donax TaxID=35708 RepID=A0A0A9FMD6_ARUDO